MITYDPRDTARQADAAAPGRPAMAMVADTTDVRLLVFRLEPGQAVPPHRNVSTVILTVLEGRGVLSGEDNGSSMDRPCTAGDVVLYAPNELLGMRAEDSELLLLATITPRPGERQAVQPASR